MINENVLKAMFLQSLKLKKEESCLVLTDTEFEDISKPFFEFAEKISDNCKFYVMEPTTRNGEEPVSEVSKLMLGYDVIIMIVKYSLTHTKARINACKKGARVASMPGVTIDMVNRCLDVDYDEMYELNQKIREKLIGSKSVRVVSELGTDVTLSVTKVCGESGGYIDKPSQCHNLPSGEVDSGVKNVNGTLVIDGTISRLGILKNDPIKVKIVDNVAVEFIGENSNKLKKMLGDVGSDAFFMAELGIGTNKKAILTGITLEDEKVYGTCHFAFGNDLHYGGNNDVQIHLDGVIDKPTIYVDDEIIMESGNLLI